MNGINRVIILGYMGRDPEVRYSQEGKAFASFSVATSETWRDKKTQEKQKRTEWHKMSAYGKTAELIGEYMKKGAAIYVEGHLQTKSWKGKDGKDQKTTEIIVDQFQMLPSTNSSLPQSKDDEHTEAPPVATADFDDDVPF